jgi:beta-glucosidase
VLLKNEGSLLPLARSLRLALIGADAKTPYTAGQGSGGVVTNAVVSPFAALTAAGISVSYDDGSSPASAAAAAAAADVAIVFGHASSGEGSDRATLLLHGTTDALIPTVAAAQPKTIVYLAVPGSIRTDWRGSVPAILAAFLPGEQMGPALVDVLYGAVPPQAKLPVTFPLGENDMQMTPEQYPGVPGNGFTRQSNYTEGLLIGHRWYERNGVAPAFPFGHGLTYGAFAYSDLSVEGRNISFTLARTAGAPGLCDTPQLYLGWPTAGSDARVPLKVLKGFSKVCGQDSARVAFTVQDGDVSNWSEAAQAWVVTRGVYAVSVGASSADIRLTGSMTV